MKSLLLDEERLARLSISLRWLMALLAAAVWLLCRYVNLPIPHVLVAQSLLSLLLGNAVLRAGLRYFRGNEQAVIQIGLCLDWWILTELLYLTGGASNPLTFLYLVPVLSAALLCSARFACAMTAITVFSYLLIYFFHLPIINPTWLHENMQIHFMGMWLTFCMTAVLICGLVTWLMANLHEREIRLRAAYQNQMRDEHLLWLGMNAANLTHQLSTPMNNLYLLLDDVRAQNHADLDDDLALMHTQLEECRQILQSLRRERRDDGERVDFTAAFAEHLAKWQNLRPQVSVDWQSDIAAKTLLNIDALFWPAVFNIVNNAADAGDNSIEIATSLQDACLRIEIVNRSGSLPRNQLEGSGLQALPSQKPSGLGLGMKLSHATFEKLGGSLTLSNQHQGGVRAVISLPVCPL